MKKQIQIAIAALIISVSGYSQSWLPKAIVINGNSKIIFEQWVKLPSQKVKGQHDYMYFRRNTPVGLRDLVSKTATLLELAKKDWDDTHTDDVTLPKYVNGIFDYQSLPLALDVEDASVVKIWEIGVWDVMMQFRKDYSIVYITKR